jgi:glucose/arabinose dehydrogenase
MANRTLSAWLLFTAGFATACTSKDEVTRGAAIFRERCAVCHASASAESGGQGPGLANVVGRKAGTGGGFGYSAAIRASGLSWDKATLDRFLAAPSQVVPATTMPVATPSPDDRRALIAYLATLDGSGAVPTKDSQAAQSSGGDYRSDHPGARRHVTVDALPAPFATPSVRNGASIVPRPAGVSPAVPAGFTVDLFAKDLTNPRAIRVAPNGDIFLSETAAGRVRVVRAKDGAKSAEASEVFAAGLDEPFGLAFFPPGPNPEWVYVANTNSVVRFPYANGDLRARGPASMIVSALAGTGGHSTRDVAFSPDGARMFVSVGSGSNVAEGMPLRPPVDAHAWEQSHGLGAAWGDEEWRADVLVFTPDGKNKQIFAAGIRNCVGLAVCPETGDLWCSTNERDGLGDNLVPDYVTRVREGAFYGWPWLYLGSHVDPRHPAERPDLVGKVTVPDVLLQAHSASLEMVFYEGAMFPPEFHGNAFAAFHGSWNRASRTGPKVVRVLVHDGVPTGEYEDFMTGFVADEGHVWGRPVGIAVAKDGALLVSEDANETVWRVSRP